MSTRWWSMIALLGIAMIAVMRCVIVFAPQVYFDVDPAIDPSPLAGMGMAGSLMLDVLLLLFCAIGFIGIARNGRLHWRTVVLAMLPLPVIVHHGWSDAGDMWRGATWFAAVMAAVVVAHLTHDRMLRIVFTSLLLAAIAPLLLRGASQMTYEHADTIAAYEQHREEFLRDRGWEPESPNVQIYERRLKQPQPLGWFFTTNIFASVMVVAAVVFAGLSVAGRRAKLTSGWVGVAGMLAVTCIVMTYFSGSKGAMLALFIGLVVCLAPLATSRVRPIFTRFAPHTLLSLIALAILGVIARGTILPEAFLNEKSLLFRWHYLVSAADMFANNALLGVGPDGFQAAYTQFRLPRNPEEVISAHAIFTDWLATLGVVAVAWVALVVLLLWRAGRALRIAPEAAVDHDTQATFRVGVRMAGLIAVVALGVGIMAEVHVLDGLSLTMRGLGALGYASLVVALVWFLSRIEFRCLNWSLAAAAVSLVVHGQIEMTFFLHGSVVWALCVVGLAAGCVGFETTGRTVSRWPCYAASGLVAGVAVIVLVTAAVPAMSQQAQVREAVTAIHPVAPTREQQVQQRTAAADILVRAYETFPANPQPLHAAIRQYEVAAIVSTDNQQRDVMLALAITAADRVVTEHPGLEALGTRAALHARYAALRDDDAAWQRAIADARRSVELDPHSNMSWLMLGDYLWSAGRVAEAADAYERALLNDANFELDPLKQMPERRRELVIERVAEAQGE